MGNAILSRGHGHVKIMKLDGEVVKLKVPVTVDEILKDYPGYVILHSDAVRHMGVRAKPLDGSANLKARHLYFLVQLPKLENYHCAPRKVRSGIVMSAKSRLESLLLARRSISDITLMNSANYGSSDAPTSSENGALRMKVRLTRAQLAQMMAESQDSSETAEKILESYLENAQTVEMDKEKEKENAQTLEMDKEDQNQASLPWKPALGSIPETCKKARGNRVKFSSTQKEQVF